MKSFKQFLMENPPAWHGTPHHFDAFSIDNIGTGEGHQAFGWGLYFAGERKVAEYYRDVLYDDEYIKQVNDKLDQLVKQMDPYRAFEYGKFKDPRGYELKAEYDRLMDERSRKSQDKALYHVEIIPSEDEMLDWDQPLNKQSEIVRNALASIGIVVDSSKLNKFDDALLTALSSDEVSDAKLPEQPRNPTGEEIYHQLVREQRSDKAASLYLLSIGIHGIKYLDNFSRHTGGTRNYVIFSDKDVVIKEKL